MTITLLLIGVNLKMTFLFGRSQIETMHKHLKS